MFLPQRNMIRKVSSTSHRFLFVLKRLSDGLSGVTADKVRCTSAASRPAVPSHPAVPSRSFNKAQSNAEEGHVCGTVQRSEVRVGCTKSTIFNAKHKSLLKSEWYVSTLVFIDLFGTHNIITIT